ncbi:MAG: proliferating cell nuclear antigen (pcna) [Methanobacteriaceae archaeon]|nr:proliferating cell nuclear antigen (pcna) [Methanobacteriaceae archaeon]
MFKIVLSDPSILKTSFDAISGIVDEVQIEVDTDGLRLNAMDRSHITYVHLELKAELFDIYKCETPHKINVDTDELIKVLKRAKNDDVIELTLEEESNLILVFEGATKRTFKVKLIDIDYESASQPEIEFPVKLNMPIDVFKNTIQDIEIASDKVSFKVDKDNLTLEAVGDFADAKVEYLHGEKISEEIESIYSIDKIKEMLKADRFANNLYLSLGDKLPLKFALVLEKEEGELIFLLAPRLEEQ